MFTSSSDSEIKHRKKFVMMHFVPANDPDEYEIVDLPSDDENDIDKGYDTNINLRNLEPMARLHRAYSIRGYNEFRYKEEFKDGKWYYCIFVGESGIYEATSRTKDDASHVAAIYFMKDLIKEDDGKWMTQLGLPNDIKNCLQILDTQLQEYESKLKEIDEINGEDPVKFLNEFGQFYVSKGIPIKNPVYETEEDKDNSEGKPMFCCIGNFRAQEFRVLKPTKQDAQTEVATKFVKKLIENDEINQFMEDRKRMQQRKKFRNRILCSEGSQEQKHFDQYFENDPYSYATICNNGPPEIRIENDKMLITCSRGITEIRVNNESIEETKKIWAIGYLRKAFVDRLEPTFFEKHISHEMINSLNDFYREITVPKLWENEER